jgi:hypothetical protein
LLSFGRLLVPGFRGDHREGIFGKIQTLQHGGLDMTWTSEPKKKRSKRSRNLRTQREVIDFFIGDGAMVFPLKGLRAFPLKITAMERWNCWNLHSYFCYPLWFQQAGILKRSLLPPVMFVGLETILTIYSRYIYHKSYLLEWFKPTL